MRSSTKRVLSVIASGFLMLAVFGVYVGLIQPELGEVEKLRSVVASKETLFENQASAVSEVQKLIEQFQGVSKIQETVSLAMPLEEDVTQSLNQLQAITRTNGITLQSFAVRPLALEASKQPVVKRLGTLQVESTIRGSYEGIKNVMRALEANVRVANVKSFRMEAESDQASRGQDMYRANLAFQIFYQGLK